MQSAKFKVQSEDTEAEYSALCTLHNEIPAQMKPTLINIVTDHTACGFFRGLLGYLGNRGFEITLVSSPSDVLEQVASGEGVSAHAISMEREISPWRDFVSLWKIYRLLKKEKPAIVNAGTPKAALLGMMAAWLSGVPVRVFQQRGLRLETCKGLKYVILTMAEKITCRCATRIICNSESIRQKMLAWKLAPSEKLTLLCSGSSKGIDCTRYSIHHDTIREALALRDKYAIPPDAPVIGTVGRIVKDKGIAELVQTFKKISAIYPNARLILVGSQEKGNPVEKEVLQWLEQSTHVILTGHRDHVVPYYHLFDVFVFPSYREGFPNVVLEAAAMGIPTVGFHATGVVDAIADGETGTIVPMKDFHAMAKAVLQYLNDPCLRFRHGLNGRRRVVRDFQPPMLWEAYCQEYCELLRQKKISEPELEVKPEPPALITPEEDMKEFAKWYAVRETVLRKADLAKVSRELDVDETEVRELCELC